MWHLSVRRQDPGPLLLAEGRPMATVTQKNRTTDGVQAVSLALQLLEILAFGGRPCRVTELAEALGTSKTRVFRHLRTLNSLGYVVQDPVTERYGVGARLAELGGAVARQLDLLGISRPSMRSLRDALGFTVILSKVDHRGVYVIGQVDGASWLTLGIVIGTRLSLYASAQGKLVLAFGATDRLEDAVAAGLKPQTSQTITDAAVLRHEIQLIRERGWAVAPGETVSGVNSLAMPLFGRDHELVATLAVLASVDDLPQQPSRKCIELLRAAAQEISEKLVSEG